MLSANSIRKQLLRSIDQTLLSYQNEEFPKLVLANFPIYLRDDIKVTHLDRPLLDSKPTGIQQNWPEQRMNSVEQTILVMVLAGEADVRIGTTHRIAEAISLDNEWTRGGEHVLHLKAPSCLLISPDTPFSDGSRPHWEDNHVPPPDSTLLWISEKHTGMLCHICRTEGHVHMAGDSLQVHEPDTQAILNLLKIELGRRSNSSKVICQQYLTVLLLCIRRCLVQNPAVIANTISLQPILPQPTDKPKPSDRIIKEANEFIHNFMREAITLSDIARHCGVSPTHLNRVFNLKLGMSATRFIYVQRIRSAQRVLCESDLPIKAVAAQVGFSSASHFSRAFQAAMDMSPSEYRARHRV